jgi:hypothetical protein
MHYGNHHARPTIEPGHLADYSLVNGGRLPCKVVSVPTDRFRVIVRATASRPGYKLGEELPVSSLFLSHRSER